MFDYLSHPQNRWILLVAGVMYVIRFFDWLRSRGDDE